MKTHWSAAGVLAAALFTAPARAECDPRGGVSTCLTTDALWPLPTPQRFAYASGTTLPSASRFAVALTSAYQKRPLSLHVPNAGPTPTELRPIDEQLSATLGLAFGVIDRLAAYAAIPMTIFENGSGSSALTGRAVPATTTFRDPRVGAAFAVLPGRAVSIAAFTDVQIPTGSTTDFNGERGLVISPSVALDARFATRFVVSTQVGARVRTAPQEFVGERQASQILAAVGLGADLYRELIGVGVEARTVVGIDGRSTELVRASGLTATETKSLLGGEWLGSLRTSLLDNSVTIMAGAGTMLPFDAIIGMARMRAVLGLTYVPGREHRPPAPPVKEQVEEPPPPAPPPPKVEEPPPPPPPIGTCVAVCRADLSSEETRSLSEQVKPYLVETRQCLVRGGFEGILPSLILRFDAQGQLLSRLLDTAGADLDCTRDLAKRPVTFAVKGATSARCDLTCR